MVGTLLKKEFMEHVLSLRFVVASILSVVLVTLSLIVLRADYRQKKEAYDINRDLYKKEAERRGSYGDLELEGVHVDRPPQKLQVFYHGLEKLEDKTAKVMAFLVPSIYGELYKSPVSALFPTTDILYVVATVLSLMAFVFSFDAISGERESETLKLTLSYSVPRDMVILAKWLGGYLSLMTPFVIALVVAAVIIQASRGLGLTLSQWQAYLFAALASFVFVAVMFSLGLFVSSRCTRSSTSIMILLLIWVGMVLMIPNASPYIANQVTRVTPRDVVENMIRHDIGDIVRDFTARMEREWRNIGMQRRVGGQIEEQARVELEQRLSKLWQDLQEETNRVTERKWDGFERELTQQVNVAKMISRLSPVSSYVYIVTDVAGTGVRQQLHFMNALRQYQRVFRRYIQDKTKGEGGRALFFGGREPEYDVADMPEFNYVEEPVAARVTGSLLDLAMLGVEAILFFMAAFVSFVRVDVI